MDWPVKKERKQDCSHHVDHSQLQPFTIYNHMHQYCARFKKLGVCATTHNNNKNRTMLVQMILNGKGLSWLWSTTWWVQSCFFFLTGQSNIADLIFFALVIVELDTTYISTSCPVAMLLTVPREKITSCCYFLVTVAQKPHQPNMVKNQLQT